MKAICSYSLHCSKFKTRVVRVGIDKIQECYIKMNIGFTEYKYIFVGQPFIEYYH